jgi:hypothetical protein
MPSDIYNNAIVLTHWGRTELNHTSGARTAAGCLLLLLLLAAGGGSGGGGSAAGYMTAPAAAVSFAGLDADQEILQLCCVLCVLRITAPCCVYLRCP